MDRNDSGIYTCCNRKNRLSNMLCHVSNLAGISHSVFKETVDSIQTPACCVSKLRSNLEAGKKLPRVWLQYVCGMTEMLLYPSFRVPLVLLLSPYGDSEMARNGSEDCSKWCATSKTCLSAYEAGLVALRTYVYKAMTPGSYSVLGVHKMPNEDSFHDKLKELYLKHFPEFSFSFFNAIFDKLIVYRTPLGPNKTLFFEIQNYKYR